MIMAGVLLVLTGQPVNSNNVYKGAFYYNRNCADAQAGHQFSEENW